MKRPFVPNPDYSVRLATEDNFEDLAELMSYFPVPIEICRVRTTIEVV